MAVWHVLITGHVCTSNIDDGAYGRHQGTLSSE